MTLKEARLQCIIEALQKLGGKAKYSDLYNEIRKCNNFKNHKFASEENFQASVRRLIQEHTSDSTIYSDENPDLFYSVGGLGSGFWGLRNYSSIIDDSGFDSELPGFLEGKTEWKMHRTIERNSKLIEDAKKNFIQEHGKLYCEVCDFNFEEKYAALGTHYIEAHHKVPLAKTGERKTTFEDLLMVCSNCHRMIHRSEKAMNGDWSSILRKNNK